MSPFGFFCFFVAVIVISGFVYVYIEQKIKDENNKKLNETIMNHNMEKDCSFVEDERISSILSVSYKENKFIVAGIGTVFHASEIKGLKVGIFAYSASNISYSLHLLMNDGEEVTLDVSGTVGYTSAISALSAIAGKNLVLSEI